MKRVLLFITAGAALLVGCTKEEEPTAANTAATPNTSKPGTPEAAGAPTPGLRNGGKDIEMGTKLGN